MPHFYPNLADASVALMWFQKYLLDRRARLPSIRHRTRSTVSPCTQGIARKAPPRGNKQIVYIVHTSFVDCSRRIPPPPHEIRLLFSETCFMFSAPRCAQEDDVFVSSICWCREGQDVQRGKKRRWKKALRVRPPRAGGRRRDRCGGASTYLITPHWLSPPLHFSRKDPPSPCFFLLPPRLCAVP